MRGLKSLQKRIPVPLAFSLIFLLIGLFGFVWNIQKKNNLKTSAVFSPTKIKITNINSDSFTVSWITTEETTGWVIYGETPDLKQTALDVRDTFEQRKAYKTHYVTINGLQPNNKYYFKIVSGGTQYGNQGKLYETTTAPQREKPITTDLSQGKILKSSNEPAAGVIVYLSLANTTIQSALTDQQGHWVIPLSSARTIDLKEFSNYDRNSQIIEIFCQGETETSSVRVTTGNDNPVPDIVLGQNYDFINTPPTPSPTPTGVQENFPPVSHEGFSALETQPSLSIIYPKENEDVTHPQPEFFGLGPKGEEIEIKVESEQEITDKIKVDARGEWKWVPPENLTPGEHKITVSYTDKDGFVQKVTKTFIVLASGESNLPAFSATPSATLITPSLTPSPTPSLSPTPTESITPPVSVTTTLVPTSTILPSQLPRQTIPSTESGNLRPGMTLPTALLVGIGTLVVIGGIIIFFF